LTNINEKKDQSQGQYSELEEPGPEEWKDRNLAKKSGHSRLGKEEAWSDHFDKKETPHSTS
jgi:hypothetical protein